MFGYIKAHPAELKVKDYEVYKGVYCSLCKTLGKRYGLISRMFLNYDLSFLALALISLSDTCPGFKIKKCDFNPSKKCSIAKNLDDELAFAADVCIILTYFKIKDAIKDKNKKEKLLAYMSLPHMHRLFKKARANNEVIADLVKDYIEAQDLIEEVKSPSIDKAADPTGKLLASLFAYGEKDEMQKQVRHRLGYCLGRWIYIIDACDDYHSDLKLGNYNPYVLYFKNADHANNILEKMQGDLNQTAAEAALAFNLLDTKRFKEIIENVIYDGLYHESKSVLNRRFANAKEPL